MKIKHYRKTITEMLTHGYTWRQIRECLNLTSTQMGDLVVALGIKKKRMPTTVEVGQACDKWLAKHGG